jgi:Porin subfamily
MCKPEPRLAITLPHQPDMAIMICPQRAPEMNAMRHIALAALALLLAGHAGTAKAQNLPDYTLPADIMITPPASKATPLAKPGKPVPVTAQDNAIPCPEYGAGYVRYPGSTTCVRLSGRVSAEAQVQSRRSLSGDTSGTRVTTGAAIQTRTPTDFGTFGVTVVGRATRATGTAATEPWR